MRKVQSEMVRSPNKMEIKEEKSNPFGKAKPREHNLAKR